MGNCCERKTKRKKIVLLLVGLDNAGKTVTAKGLAGERSTSPIPTVGFSVIKLKYTDYNVHIYDLGGGVNIRGIWSRYFVDAHGVIFVLDSSDFTRFNEVKIVLEQLLNDQKITGKPLLLLANKQDDENSLDEIDIIEYLNIETLVNKNQCPTLVQSCSATENDLNKLDLGIRRGYEWLLKYIIRNYEHLDSRVTVDTAEQEKIVKQEMIEKWKRIKASKEEDDRRAEEDAIESYSDYARKLHNGQTTIKKQFNTSKIHSETTSSDSITNSSSSDSLRSVYLHERIKNDVYDRPKSAIQIVKRQLQLNNDIQQHNVKRTNKTAPIHLYGVRLPLSAKERRKSFATERRNLKSADDCIFTISNNVGNTVGPSGDFHKEMFQLNNFNRPVRLVSPAKSIKNGDNCNTSID